MYLVRAMSILKVSTRKAYFYFKVVSLEKYFGPKDFLREKKDRYPTFIVMRRVAAIRYKSNF